MFLAIIYFLNLATLWTTFYYNLDLIFLNTSKCDFVVSLLQIFVEPQVRHVFKVFKKPALGRSNDFSLLVSPSSETLWKGVSFPRCARWPLGKVKVGRVRQVVFTIQLQTIQRRELWTTLVFHLPGQQYSRADLLRTIFGKAMELFFTDESSQEFPQRTNHKLFPYMR